MFSNGKGCEALCVLVPFVLNQKSLLPLSNEELAIKKRNKILLATPVILIVVATFTVISHEEKLAREFRSPEREFWDWEIHQVTSEGIEFRSANPVVPLEEVTEVIIDQLEIENRDNTKIKANYVVKILADGTQVFEIKDYGLQVGDQMTFWTGCQCEKAYVLTSRKYGVNWRTDVTLKESDLAQLEEK